MIKVYFFDIDNISDAKRLNNGEIYNKNHEGQGLADYFLLKQHQGRMQKDMNEIILILL